MVRVNRDHFITWILLHQPYLQGVQFSPFLFYLLPFPFYASLKTSVVWLSPYFRRGLINIFQGALFLKARSPKKHSGFCRNQEFLKCVSMFLCVYLICNFQVYFCSLLIWDNEYWAGSREVSPGHDDTGRVASVADSH